MNKHYAKDITSNYTASYAKYVATSRAIPRLVDGLKPVQRRCINSADDLKLYHDKKYLKVAKLEGQVMGDYHPHGGASMTILAQPFKTRYPLFEGQGNWGSPDEPNSVAASRYIETKMTKFCEDFYLSSADYADREDNYDGRLKEVVQYYPPIPGVLLTGASGIAVGLSTNIPPHTITDVCNSLLSFLDNPNSDEYIKFISPETCEESIILTPKKDIEKLYRTGEGSIQYKAKTHYESIDGKLALVVDAFPPEYRKKSLETSYILEAVESGVLELINESKDTIRYVFLSNDKSVLEAIEERLTSSAGYRMYIEHQGKIKCYKLSELYEDFIESRKGYIIRKYSDLRRKNLAEIEFLRVLMEFKKDREYIKSMFDKSHKEVVEDIIIKYETNEAVANRIVSSTLSSMMKDNAEKLERKYEELIAQVKLYEGYVESPIGKIKEDIENLRIQYVGEKRRAIHIDNVSNKLVIDYNGEKIETTPSSTFILATSDNKYSIVNATELVDKDLSSAIVVSTEYDYYVMYDEIGLIAITRELMLKGDNKFRSNNLKGIIGTNSLEDITIYRSNNKREIIMNKGYLRTRLSYIPMVSTDATIKLSANIES